MKCSNPTCAETATVNLYDVCDLDQTPIPFCDAHANDSPDEYRWFEE